MTDLTDEDQMWLEQELCAPADLSDEPIIDQDIIRSIKNEDVVEAQ